MIRIRLDIATGLFLQKARSLVKFIRYAHFVYLPLEFLLFTV